MSDEAARIAAKKTREEKEGVLVSLRIAELHLDPIKGTFDASHLKAVHGYLFQDLPHHRPGTTRDDTAETWIKHRALEGTSAVYDVPYLSQGVEARIADILQSFGGPASITGLAPDLAAASLAALYADLDHAHGFYEGNSRTLREFTRELALEGGYALDWVKAGVGAKERNALYVARDLAVLERAFPGLTPEKAMQTDDRAEYEAFYILRDLRRAVGDRPLATIIRHGLSPAVEQEPAQEPPSTSVPKDAVARPWMDALRQRVEAAASGQAVGSSSPDKGRGQEAGHQTRDDPGEDIEPDL